MIKLVFLNNVNRKHIATDQNKIKISREWNEISWFRRK